MKETWVNQLNFQETVINSVLVDLDLYVIYERQTSL